MYKIAQIISMHNLLIVPLRTCDCRILCSITDKLYIFVGLPFRSFRNQLLALETAQCHKWSTDP